MFMIVIAGGPKGIGLEIAEHFAKKGETVVAAYARDTAAAEKAQARLAKHGAPVHVIQADFDSAAGTIAFAKALEAVPGTVDVFVHSVVRAEGGPVLDIDLDAFSRA